MNGWLSTNCHSIFQKQNSQYFLRKPKNIPLKIKIQNIIIKQAQDFIILGLILNENLSWKNHCDKTSNNISKSVGVLNRLKYFIPKDIRIMLYNSMIVSHMNYCILAWSYKFNRICDILWVCICIWRSVRLILSFGLI